MENGLPVEVARLPEKLMRSFREAFAKFDPANDDVVAATELLTMLHSLALNPTERELKSASDDLLRGGTRLTFVVFCRASTCGAPAAPTVARPQFSDTPRLRTHPPHFPQKSPRASTHP